MGRSELVQADESGQSHQHLVCMQQAQPGPVHSEELLSHINYIPQCFKGSGTCLMTSQMKLWVVANRHLELFRISYRSFHIPTFPNKSCLVLQASKCVRCFAFHGANIINNVLMTMQSVCCKTSS